MSDHDNKPYTITVGELLDELSHHNRAARLYFGNGDLAFTRMKLRGEYVTVEFNQLYQITDDPDAES